MPWLEFVGAADLPPATLEGALMGALIGALKGALIEALMGTVLEVLKGPFRPPSQIWREE